MLKKLWLYCFLRLLIATCALAQPPAAPSRTIIRAGHVLDVHTGKMLTNQTIVIEDGKIVSVGPDAGTTAGATVIDLSGKTVLPGLIDAHTHLTMDPSFGYETLSLSIPRQALTGAKNARVTLLAGFTTVRNVGAEGYSDIALRDAVNAGDVPGPRILASGPPLGITGGHCDNDMLPYEYHATADGVADGVENVQHKTREVIKYGADVVKICATGGVLSLGDNPQHAQYTQAELEAIVADAHRLGRKVAAHAHGAEGIVWAANAGVDSIEHGSYIDDAGIAAMKQHGTYLVPTLWLGDWLIENAAQTHMPPSILAKAKQVLPRCPPECRKSLRRRCEGGVRHRRGRLSARHECSRVCRDGEAGIDAACRRSRRRPSTMPICWAGPIAWAHWSRITSPTSSRWTAIRCRT